MTRLVSMPTLIQKIPGGHQQRTAHGEFIAVLARTIREAILCEHPHDGGRGAGLFAGSFDWHSCVHAHWALLSICRYRHSDELHEFLRARLTRDAIEREWSFLSQHADFELPYGRAWLLLALDEALRHPDIGVPWARPIRDEAWREIHGWLHDSPFPEQSDRFAGDHGSWLFSLFLLILTSTRTTSELHACTALYMERVEPVHHLLRDHAPGGRDFIDMPALLATIRALIGHSEPSEHELSDPLEVEFDHCHSYGRMAVRLWPYAVVAARDHDAASRLDYFLSRIQERPELWTEDFPSISHWVPQFLWMALWLAMERP